MTNKYAEGYPGRRYYGGCQHVDCGRDLAIDRARRLFDCGFANVQPNSGSQANQAVFLALMKPGDTFLAMDLSAGGHLTHGAKPNVSGKWFNPVHYGVRPQDHMLDYDQVAELAAEHRPKLIIAGGSAIPRWIDFARFREIADEVGAYLHVDMAHIAGLVAGGQHPSPLPHAHVVTSTTHKTLRGPRRAHPHERRGAVAAADPFTRTFEARYTLGGAGASAPLGSTVTIRTQVAGPSGDVAVRSALFTTRAQARASGSSTAPIFGQLPTGESGRPWAKRQPAYRPVCSPRARGHTRSSHAQAGPKGPNRAAADGRSLMAGINLSASPSESGRHTVS
jgi:hypothetical protein